MKESRASTNATNRNMPVTVASVLFLVFGLGTAVSTPYLLAYVILNGSGPTAFGIEFLYGNVPFWNLWGFNAGVILSLALAGVSALEAVAGFWLWQSRKKGGMLGVGLLPVDLFFAYGFGIPILWLVPPLRSILLALGWRSLY